MDEKSKQNAIISLISKFRHVLNVVFFLLGEYPASEFYVSTFRNTSSNFIGLPPRKMEESVPKRRRIKFRRRGLTQK